MATPHDSTLRGLGLSEELSSLSRQALDHGIDCASGGEVVIPFVMTVTGASKTTVHRLMAADMPGAEHMLRSLLADTSDPVRMYAFATDRLLTRTDKKLDAIVVEAAERGGAQAVLLAQCYQRAVDGHEFGPFDQRLLLGRVNSRLSTTGQLGSGSKHDFAGDEWECLLRSPVLAFLLVAAADGSVDRKEMQAFQKQIIAGFQFSSALMSAVLADALTQLEPLLMRTVSGDVNPAQDLLRVAEIVDAKLAPEDANEFKLSLLYIGKQVAEASGGFFGFGSKISKKELQALAVLGTLLRVQLPGK